MNSWTGYTGPLPPGTPDEWTEYIRSLDIGGPPAVKSEYPYDVLIYCNDCACHYMVEITKYGEFATCKSNPDHKLGESTLTKSLAKKSK